MRKSTVFAAVAAVGVAGVLTACELPGGETGADRVEAPASASPTPAGDVETIVVETTPTGEHTPAPEPAPAPEETAERAEAAEGPEPGSEARPVPTVTRDPELASAEIRRLRATGWYNPNRIEYASDPVVSLLQFKYWLDKGYIAPDGDWSTTGKAEQGWMDTGYEAGQLYQSYTEEQG